MAEAFTANDATLYIPYYNSQECVGACLEGVARQTAKPARTILFDDASETAAFMIDAVSKSGAEVVRLGANIGLGASRNRVLELCKTKLLAALDSDVVAEPQWLEKMIAALNAHPEAAGVGGRLDELRQGSLGDRWRAVHMRQHWGDEFLVNPRFLYGANTLFRVDALREAGAYSARLKTNYEDMDLSQRLRDLGKTLLYEPAARCGHLKRDTEASALRGLWRWFHAKGLLDGDFNTPDGLLRRIDAVNFGIYRYRADLDWKEGRHEFLKMHILLPWLFCALDLELARRETGMSVPLFPAEGLLSALPQDSLKILREALPKPFKGVVPVEPWHTDYIAKFIECLRSFKWIEDRERLVEKAKNASNESQEPRP